MRRLSDKYNIEHYLGRYKNRAVANISCSDPLEAKTKSGDASPSKDAWGVVSLKWGPVTESRAIDRLREALLPLCETPVHYLRLPADMAQNMEPSQVGTIVGTLTDLMLPRIALEKGIGLTKAAGLLGEREGYPDFTHDAGYRIELKGTFTDNPNVALKKPPTPREPSARLTQKVTVKNVAPETDALLLLVYRLEPMKDDSTLLSPTIKGVGIFPVIECVRARDARMTGAGGRWFGNYETPTILSRAGKRAKMAGELLNGDRYGRKESEGWHFNEDTSARGQRLTEESDFDSRLPFGGRLGRTDWFDG